MAKQYASITAATSTSNRKTANTTDKITTVSSDEDELEEFVEASNQEYEELENDIDDGDLAIIERFNLSKEDWAGMEAERKEFYRKEFERLG